MDTEPLCPKCKAPLLYCKGDSGPDYCYCPACLDAPYDPEQSEGVTIGVFT